MEIVKLIGSDVLPDDQKLTLEIAQRDSPWIPAAERISQRRYVCISKEAVRYDGYYSVSL